MRFWTLGLIITEILWVIEVLFGWLFCRNRATTTKTQDQTGSSASFSNYITLYQTCVVPMYLILFQCQLQVGDITILCALRQFAAPLAGIITCHNMQSKYVTSNSGDLVWFSCSRKLYLSVSYQRWGLAHLVRRMEPLLVLVGTRVSKCLSQYWSMAVCTVIANQ